jgi:hypothetical protein
VGSLSATASRAAAAPGRFSSIGSVSLRQRRLSVLFRDKVFALVYNGIIGHRIYRGQSRSYVVTAIKGATDSRGIRPNRATALPQIHAGAVRISPQPVAYAFNPLGIEFAMIVAQRRVKDYRAVATGRAAVTGYTFEVRGLHRAPLHISAQRTAEAQD